MKKILILAYDFPPYNSIGAQRPYSWYKYFKEFELYPIVITRHWDTEIQNPIDYIKPSLNKAVSCESNEYGTIYRVPFAPNMRDRFILKYGLSRLPIIRKILSLWYIFAEFIHPFFDAKYAIYLQAKKICAEQKIDSIIACAEPFILFSYAKKLHKKYSIPWIADYRDGWSTDTLSNLTFFNRIIYSGIFSIIEKKIVRTSSCITTAAPVYKQQLENLFLTKKIHVVFNGYFEELYTNNSKNNTSCFSISYAGQIYDYQPIEIFLEGVKLFLEKTNCTDIRICFYGINFYTEQKQRVQEYSSFLEPYLFFTDRLPADALLSELESSHVLLLLSSPHEERLAGKLFDYLPLQKKILFVLDDYGVMSSILHETNTGVFCEDVISVAEQISQAYKEWQQTGRVACNSQHIEQYSRKNQAQVMAGICKQILLGEE